MLLSPLLVLYYIVFIPNRFTDCIHSWKFVFVSGFMSVKSSACLLDNLCLWYGTSAIRTKSYLCLIRRYVPLTSCWLQPAALCSGSSPRWGWGPGWRGWEAASALAWRHSPPQRFSPASHQPLSPLHCHLSTVTSPLSPLHCHLSTVTSLHCHLSTVTSPLSPLYCHLSTVTSLLSPLHCHLSFFIVVKCYIQWYTLCTHGKQILANASLGFIFFKKSKSADYTTTFLFLHEYLCG